MIIPRAIRYWSGDCCEPSDLSAAVVIRSGATWLAPLTAQFCLLLLGLQVVNYYFLL